MKMGCSPSIEQLNGPEKTTYKYADTELQNGKEENLNQMTIHQKEQTIKKRDRPLQSLNRHILCEKENRDHPSEEERIPCIYSNFGDSVHICQIDFRLHDKGNIQVFNEPKNLHHNQLWVDSVFTKQVALDNQSSNLFWKRPQEFCNNPQLLCEGTTRFDVGQGDVASCWFLSILATIADNPALLFQIIPKDAYPIQTCYYKGYFKCKFWKFGVWYDVYVDDFLPVKHDNTLWGAKSVSNPNEMWVPLVEKAFAKFHGSYNKIYFGSASDAYLSMTGGVASCLLLKNLPDKVKFYSHVQSALVSGSIVTSSVIKEIQSDNGLLCNHAYTVVATNTATIGRKTERLFRLRNPWGHTEWKGRWNDKSEEFRLSNLPGTIANDGEFYLALDDYYETFTHVTICSLKPDFDQDGNDDMLTYRTCTYGEWLGNSATGFRNRLNSPKFHFHLTSLTGHTKSVPVVFQLIQYQRNRQSELYPIRLDIFKVVCSDFVSEDRYMVINTDTEPIVYDRDRQITIRSSLTPGMYMIIPSTYNKGSEGQFYIRIFTQNPIYNVCQVKKCKILSCDTNSTVLVNKVPMHLSVMKGWLGSWIQNTNAGGQMSYPSYYENPTLEFWTSGNVKSEPVQLCLMQDPQKRLPIGFKLFTVDTHKSTPLNENFMKSEFIESPSSVSGEAVKFAKTDALYAVYNLKPATQYIATLFTDKPNMENTFGVLLMTQRPLRTRFTELQSSTSVL